MLQTHVRPSRDLRNNYSELAGLVKEHNQVIITNNGRGEAVLIGIEDYAQYEEFLHRRYVAQELEKAEQEAKKEGMQWVEHGDVWKALREKYEL